jgi:hypothetical protein
VIPVFKILNVTFSNNFKSSSKKFDISAVGSTFLLLKCLQPNVAGFFFTVSDAFKIVAYSGRAVSFIRYFYLESACQKLTALAIISNAHAFSFFQYLFKLFLYL